MRRSTRTTSKRIQLDAESSEDDKPKRTKLQPNLKNKTKSTYQENKASNVIETPAKTNYKQEDAESSSSESDIENYLHPVDEIDLDSTFFQVAQKEEKSFDDIESNIFSGINKLSDSESEEEPEEWNALPKESETKTNIAKPGKVSDIKSDSTKPTTSKLNFQQLHEYTEKIEEAKKLVKKYEAKKRAKQKHLANEKPEENMNISSLLALGETRLNSLGKSHVSDIDSYSDSDSERDWEEVEHHDIDDANESIVPKDGVQITLEVPGGATRKKKGLDLIACMKRRLNRIKKENQVYVHKVHMLCWIAHGNYVNQVLNSESLLGLALSLIPSQHCYPSGRTDLSYLEQILKWYRNTIPNVEKIVSKEMMLEKAIKLQINRKQAFNKKMLVYIFICILRSLGIQCRLVISFQVAPLRPPARELHSLSTKSESTDKDVKASSSKKVSNSTKVNQDDKTKIKRNIDIELKDKKSKTKNSDLKQEQASSSTSSRKIGARKISQKNKIRDHSKESRNTTSDNSKSTTKESKEKVKSNELPIEVKIPQMDGADDSDSEPKARKPKKPNLKKLSQEDANQCNIKKHPKRLIGLSATDIKLNAGEDTKQKTTNPPKNNPKANLKKLKQNCAGESTSKHSPQQSPKKSAQNSTTHNFPTTSKKLQPKSRGEKPSKSTPGGSSSQYFQQNLSPRCGDVRNDIISIIKGRMVDERAKAQNKLVKHHKARNDSDYDSDYAPEPIRRKRHDSDDELHQQTKVKVKQRVKVKSDQSEHEVKMKKGIDVWIEVYLEAEEKWISADVTKGEAHCIKELFSRASHPITYILAWNNDNAIKDITQRYCPNWNTVTRKLRVDKKWWEDTLRPFEGKKTIRDREEDEELARLQLDQPLPTSISEYKKHPLYVLKRHLLKFEAFYPPNPLTLGFIRGEAVYARECVHILHSREVWIKYAKVVQPGEQPYKIVKARAKYDKLSGQVITDKPLELFGKWQVGDYVPPVAENGVVPRNAYGNVELFKACMLPKGTVHLQLPGLNKLARRMNIDCAPAVVGFDFHTGGSHPTFDGHVVCEEYSEILISAWYTEQEEQEKRTKEKTEKRIYGNWRKLIKGLLIRERLKARYDFGGPSTATVESKKRQSKGPKLKSKKRRLCSGSESD